LGDVNRTTDTAQSILDVRRNQIMIFEAELDICMLGFAVLTFIVMCDGHYTNFEIWIVEDEQIPQGAVFSLNKAQLV
jgi:hypothetical protein